jgi:hypothetical protein
MGEDEKSCGTSSREIAKISKGCPWPFSQLAWPLRRTPRSLGRIPENTSRSLAEETGWYHAMVGIFAGALRYTIYGFVKRYLMKRSQEIRTVPTPRMTTSTLTGTPSATPPRSSCK